VAWSAACQRGRVPAAIDIFASGHALGCNHGGEESPLALLDANPLHRAAFDGHTDECVQLIKNGASIDAKTYWGFTALDLAIAQKQE